VAQRAWDKLDDVWLINVSSRSCCETANVLPDFVVPLSDFGLFFLTAKRRKEDTREQVLLLKLHELVQQLVGRPFYSVQLTYRTQHNV